MLRFDQVSYQYPSEDFDRSQAPRKRDARPR